MANADPLTNASLVKALQGCLLPIDIKLENISTDNTVLNFCSQADIILLGEASHGTQEFYEIRMAITKELIKQAKVGAIAGLRLEFRG